MGDDLVLDRSVFLGMSLAAQAEYYAENGFVLLPRVLEQDDCTRILQDMQEIAAQHEDWKFAFDYQGLAYGTQYEGAYGSWPPRSIEQLIANPTVLASTRNLYGADAKFFKGVFVHSFDRPERQGLHRDYDATGQNGNDYRNSCENWCNIGIYLVDQTPEQGPLWVVPGSNRLPRQLDFGRAGDDFNAHFSPHARMVCARAGDAVIFHCLTVIFHCLTVHAGGGHTLEAGRAGCFHSYRAGDSKPAGRVVEWDEVAAVQAARPAHDPALAPLLQGLNDDTGSGSGAARL